MRLIAALLLSIGLAGVANASQIHWNRFYWDQGRKDGLFVPVKFDKLPNIYLMQFDTGATETVFYQVPLRTIEKPLGIIEGSNRPLSIGLEIGGFHFSDFVRYDHGLHIQNDFGDPISGKDLNPVIGSVGPEIFADHIVLLDYPGQRIALMAHDWSLPASLMTRATFVSATYDTEHHVIYLPVKINGVVYPRDYILDTGSSELALNTTLEIWRRVTGHHASDQDVRKFTLNAWGDKLFEVEAPITGDLVIGPVVVSHAEASAMVKGPKYQEYSNAGYHILGVIGNAPFYDHYMLIFDLPHKRLGFIREN